ncbi:MAG: hypothetical protein AAFY59_19255, partial [Pseudomonadota bacterium]
MAEQWGRKPERLQLAHAFDVANGFNSDRSDWEFQILEGFGAVAEGLAVEIGPRLFLETRTPPPSSATPVTGVS